MHFDQDTSPDELAYWQNAAQQAWGDDTRHPSFVGHPDPSRGQCFVTSQWLASRLGGDVGVKDGHYLWVNPERDHGIDLTNDHQPGPTMVDRLDAPRWKGFRVLEDHSDHPRAKLFAHRANQALMAPKSGAISTKTADGAAGSDPYPGETPEKIEQMDQAPFHDEPNYEPEVAPHQFNFVWANGSLQVSPSHSHEQLLGHAGAQSDSEGPTAVGYADVQGGHVTWRVASNVGLQGLRDALAHYSHQVGWKFDGLVGTDGQPMGLNLGPIMSMWYREKGDAVQISKTPLKNGERIYVSGSTAWVRIASHPGLVDWAGDFGVALKELPSYNGRDGYSSSSQDPRVSARRTALGERSEDSPASEIEPFFPASADAIETNKISLGAAEQSNHMLERPDVLESALARPQQYYHYTGSLPQAAAALMHGVSQSQAFQDGNKRTAYALTNHFLHENGLGHIAPSEDTELAHHLIGYGEGTHNMEDTTALFQQRLNQRTAEYPGGGNMLDHMRNKENLDLFNNGDPDFQPERQNLDEDPGGPFVCHQCGAKPQSFGEFKVHMDGHEPKENVYEDGHFPLVQDFDEPLGFGSQPQPNGGNTIAMVLPNAYEAKRIPEFELYSNLFGFDDTCRYYGAYRGGWLVGYGVVREGFEPEVMMVQSAVHQQGVGTALIDHIKRHYSNFYTHTDTPSGEALMRKTGVTNVKGQLWRWSAGNEPKNLIEEDVPFVYDIPSDKLHLGYAGEHTHAVQGQFSPGGIVEGYYQPGGKVLIQTASTWPFSVRHLLDLWYWTAPQMEITSVEQVDKSGKNIKLAAEGEHVGQYIKKLLPSDIAASNAYKALRDAGGKVYAVGGAPRDALLGKVPNDIDLMVAGLPSVEVEHILGKLPGNVTFAGKNFGVFHYHAGGDTVEIALPRSDEYSGGQRSDAKINVDPNLPIADDLKRRDFTANATAVDLDTGELIDPHGGARDIQRGVLRTTHPGSFREDPSRLVRALTMHSRFGLTPDEQTRHEMESNAHLLRGESPDLLNKVFTKTLGSDNPASAIRLAHDTGLLKHLLPEVHDNWNFDQRNFNHRYPLGEHLNQVLDNTSRLTTDPDVRFAALLHDVGKPASAWTDPQTGENHYYQSSDGQGANHEDVGSQMAKDRLRSTFNLQSKRIDRIQHLIQHHMFAPFETPKGARRFIQRVGDEHADDLLNLREADQTGKGQTPEEVTARTSANQMRGLVEDARTAQAPTDVSALSINGNDLLSMGLNPGPQIGQVLRYLTDEVVSDPTANQRDRLLQLAQSYINAQPPEARI